MITSDTQPVREVMKHEQNDILVDFFNYKQLAKQVTDALHHPKSTNS